MIYNIFEKTISEYNDIECPIYVVMPNHFHAIIVIQKDYYQKGFERADMESAPTLSDIVQTFKRRSTIEYIKLVKQGLTPPFDKKVWQRSYHDHIIRNEKEFRMIWEYIDENPLKWESDCFYV
ncbi:MAG: transposase [Oscillospiraceae bacterium]